MKSDTKMNSRTVASEEPFCSFLSSFFAGVVCAAPVFLNKQIIEILKDRRGWNWTGLDRTGLDWIGEDRLPGHVFSARYSQGNGRDWSGVDQIGAERRGSDGIRSERNRSDRNECEDMGLEQSWMGQEGKGPERNGLEWCLDMQNCLPKLTY